MGFPAKPGGTYAAFYQGDRLNEPQFTGGAGTLHPTEVAKVQQKLTGKVATVTVPKDAKPEDFLWHEFKLIKRSSI